VHALLQTVCSIAIVRALNQRSRQGSGPHASRPCGHEPRRWLSPCARFVCTPPPTTPAAPGVQHLDAPVCGSRHCSHRQRPAERQKQPCRRNDSERNDRPTPAQLSIRIRDRTRSTAERSVFSVRIRAKGNGFSLLWQVARALQNGCARKKTNTRIDQTLSAVQTIVPQQGSANK